MPEPTHGLTIEAIPTGRNGTATVSVKLGGETVAVEKLDLTKSKARATFATAICADRPGIDAPAVEAELLKLAAGIAARRDVEPPAPSLPEIDASHIVRPERIIAPEVSGIAIPTMSEIGGEPVGRWLLYLRWADGRREVGPMAASIDLGKDKGRLWVWPNPAEPNPTMRPGWSVRSRRAWLAGAPTPSPEKVFKGVCERIAFYLDLPPQRGPFITATLALWAMLTYVYPAWPAVPYLYVGGPAGSGKSRVFEVLSRLVFRPLASSNLTAAALFRTIHGQGGTLLLDEAERLKQTQDPAVSEILSMLLAGYKRGGSAIRLEPVGDTFKTVCFEVFGPKALACIAGLPPALASRCIPLTMFRAAPGSDKPRRRIDADPAAWQGVRDELHVLALEHGPAWLELAGRADVCPAMSGRDYELWQPLLALATWLESHNVQGLHGLVEAHALEVIDGGRDESTPDVDETLLKLLAKSVRLGDRPTPGGILKAAQEADPETFRRWSPRGVSSRIKSYGLRTTKSCGEKVYRVTLDDLARIVEHYGMDLDLPE